VNEYLFLSIGAIAAFSFVSVVVWVRARSEERLAHYKSETIKKIAETQEAGGDSVLEYLREQEKNAARRQREGTKLGGMILVAIGVAIMVFLRALLLDAPVYLAGLIPGSSGSHFWHIRTSSPPGTEKRITQACRKFTEFCRKHTL